MVEIEYIDSRNKKIFNRIRINRLNKKYMNLELKNCNDLLSNINGYSLDIEQRKAIITEEQASLIIAGAGSGKSLTLVGKIKYLVERKKIKPNEILCITYTREASKNLMNSINKDSNYKIVVYTFHKLSLEILGSNNYLIAKAGTLEYIVDEYFYSLIFNNKEMIFKLKKTLNMVDMPYKIILNSKSLIILKKLIITFINLFKTNGYEISYFLSIKESKDLISIIIDIYYLYEKELKSSNEIDFNDMIVLATTKVRADYKIKYKYIIVDEYQDTSYIRYLLLKEIINKTNAKIICVGDDYQSIYRFSGSNINMFLNFKKYFGYTKILKINTTYRNSQELINIAGDFIMKNKSQIRKELK